MLFFTWLTLPIVSYVKRINTVSEAQPSGPEFVRPGKLEALFGISRPMVYVLAARGEIELVQCRPKGTKKGLALVNVASVREFIARHRGTQAQEAR